MLYEDDTLRGFGVRMAYTWVDLNLPSTQPALLIVAETVEKRTQLANDIIKGVIIPQFVVLPVAVLLVWFGLSRGVARRCNSGCARAGPTTCRRSTSAPRRPRSRRCWRP